MARSATSAPDRSTRTAETEATSNIAHSRLFDSHGILAQQGSRALLDVLSRLPRHIVEPLPFDQILKPLPALAVIDDRGRPRACRASEGPRGRGGWGAEGGCRAADDWLAGASLLAPQVRASRLEPLAPSPRTTVTDRSPPPHLAASRSSSHC